MSIEFEDGSRIESDNWNSMLAVIKRRAKEGKSRPTELRQSGVTIKLNGFEPKSDGKQKAQPGQPEHANYIEGYHREWKIRVWRKEAEEVYGVNYYRNETDLYYLEIPFGDVTDENGAFRYVSEIIDEI